MNGFCVEKFHRDYAEVSVPASKSILNRAMILAALGRKEVRLICGDLCEDTRALLHCLEALGVSIQKSDEGLLIHGCGDFPNKKATLDVKSAGTAARFLPAVLTAIGGEYTFFASEQMKNRPMNFSDLQKFGAEIQYLEENASFPFRLTSNGVSGSTFTVNTDESTQFASTFLLAACAIPSPVKIKLEGNRTNSAYISLTLDVMRSFGVSMLREGDKIAVLSSVAPPPVFKIEADLSSASYFCALALLCRTKIFIRREKLSSLQPDLQFLRLLEKRGLHLTETEQGLLADGSNIVAFEGFDEDFSNFSDQTLTAAALAPFAATPSRLRNIAHIRRQECDRVHAIVKNLNALGASAHSNGKDIFIQPAPVRPATIETFGDHRVAMAFALAGLKTGGIVIDNPDCCKKTFENYFEILQGLTSSARK